MGNPTPPAGTGPSGRALWRRIVADLDEALELDQRDIEVLTQACRLADRIRVLADAVAEDGALIPGAHGPRLHPAVAELRQSEIALIRHLGLIDLDVGAAGSQSAISRRARAAAQARWRDAGPSRRSERARDPSACYAAA